MRPYFACVGVRKAFAGRVVLPGVDLSLRQGSVTALVGASGCGKSTLLHILAGFLPPDAGEIFLTGAPCAKPGPERVMAFQDDALFPWLSVAENVALGLRQAGFSRQDCRRRVATVLEQVGLGAWGAALPSVLSGGMRQRAALARALALRPQSGRTLCRPGRHYPFAHADIAGPVAGRRGSDRYAGNPRRG